MPNIVGQDTMNNPKMRDDTSRIAAEENILSCIKVSDKANATYGLDDFNRGMLTAVMLGSSVGSVASAVRGHVEGACPAPAGFWRTAGSGLPSFCTGQRIRPVTRQCNDSQATRRYNEFVFAYMILILHAATLHLPVMAFRNCLPRLQDGVFAKILGIVRYRMIHRYWVI